MDDGTPDTRPGPPDRPQELAVELDEEGLVEAANRPGWVPRNLFGDGDSLSGILLLEGGGVSGVLDRTRESGRSERVAGRLGRGVDSIPVAGRVTPRPRGGWILALSPDPGLAARLFEASRATVLGSVVDQLRFGVSLVDTEGRIVYANRAEAEMHGYSQEALLGRSAGELGLGSEESDAEVPSDSGAWVRRRVNRRRDGSAFPVRLVSNVIRSETGEPLGRVTISEDIGERIRVDRMREEILRVVGHELRTPLTAVLNALVLLGREGSLGDRGAEALQIAERNGQHLLELINDMIDLQNAAAGRLEVHLEPVSLAEILREAADRAAERGDPGRIVVEPPPGGGRVLVDRERLLRVLEHVLSNALKFSPPEEPVRVSARRDDEGTTIRVADRGPGIPEPERRALLEPFAVADASTRRFRSGTGLGLALSRAVLERMEGRLDIAEPEGPGARGATILIRLTTAS